jgi:integrase
MSLDCLSMPYKKGENPNHPSKDSKIRVETIREKEAIKRIKKMLCDHPRDPCLFTLGINTAFRANELLALQVNQVEHLGQGDVLAVKQTRRASTGK